MPGGFFLSDRLRDGPVQFQSQNGGASSGAEAYQTHPAPAKMKPPRVAARIEQRRCRARERVGRGLPCALAERTGNAGESQVVESGFAASQNRNHVVGVKGRFLARLGQTAVFAAVLRPLNHMPPQMCRHHHALTPPAGSTAGIASGGGRVVRSSPPSLRPPAFPRPSKPAPGPACRAASGAVGERLWAGGTARGRLASGLQLEWLEAYVFSLMAVCSCVAKAMSTRTFLEIRPRSRRPAQGTEHAGPEIRGRGEVRRTSRRAGAGVLSALAAVSGLKARHSTAWGGAKRAAPGSRSQTSPALSGRNCTLSVPLFASGPICSARAGLVFLLH